MLTGASEFEKPSKKLALPKPCIVFTWTILKYTLPTQMKLQFTETFCGAEVVAQVMECLWNMHKTLVSAGYSCMAEGLSCRAHRCLKGPPWRSLASCGLTLCGTGAAKAPPKDLHQAASLPRDFPNCPTSSWKWEIGQSPTYRKKKNPANP